MKKSIILVLLLCLLTGCGTVPAEAEPSERAPVLTDTQPPLQTVPETIPASAAESSVQNQAEYSILENDHSIRNENADILVNIRYDQVILNTAEERWRSINDAVQADYRAFLAEVDYLNDTTPQQWEEQIKSMGGVYGNLLVSRSAKVTRNSGGIFSIRMTREWFLGGVFGCDYYGLSFDLNTGEALALSRLSHLPEEEFAAQLKEIVCAELAEDMDVLLQDPAAVLEDYTLADFSFYLEERELVLTFPTYTFGPGDMGAAVIKTGLYPQL